MRQKTPHTGQELRREFALDRAAINEADRTVELSFSSEAEVERYFGIEVLDHTPSAVRLGRLNNGGALLLEHERRDQIGVVVSARIENGVGRATVRFSKSARGQEIFQDVMDGIRSLVSVGYRIHRTESKQQAGGVELVRVTDWEPFELSLVSIPADDTVGVGRSEDIAGGNQINQSQIFSNTMNREQMIAALRAAGIVFAADASDEALRALLPAPPAVRAAEPVVAAPTAAVTVVREAAPQPSAADQIAAERRRVADISGIAEQVRRNGVEIDAGRAIAEGVDAGAFQRQAFDALLARQGSYTPNGGGDHLSRQDQRDLGSFSITRGLGAMMQGRQLSGIEAEMQQEAQNEARAAGISLAGNFHIPACVLSAGRRDMTATGGTAGDQGGTLIPTLQGSFIDLLYSKLVLRQLGAQFLSGLTGNISMPKFVSGSTIGNLGENTAASESSPTTGAVTLSPKRAATFAEISKQLLIQGNPSAEAMVRNDLTTALALLLEARAINGSGADGQPTGLLNTTGIGSVAGGTNGAAPTWANIVGLETEVAIDNADLGSLGYLTNTKVRGKLKTTSQVSGQNGMIWAGGETPLNGYRAEVTNQVPSTLTKGTASGTCSAIIFGNFADLVIATWGGIDIMANPYVKDIEGLVRITLNAYHDSAVRRPESFAAMKDALTA
jgi:HK97 family phage major capsid protein